MTPYRLIFHPGVEADIEEIVAFHGERDPALPSAFRARLKEQVDGVLLFPRAGAVLFEDYRRVLLKQFPFMVVYSASDDAIYVLAIVHVRRDPANIQREVAERTEE